MIRKSTILLLLFYFATPLYLVQAQDTTGFSYDPALFLNELEAVFSKAPEKNKKEAAELITSLRNAFNSEKLTHKLKHSVIETSNIFVSYKLNSFSRLYNYFLTLNTCFRKENIPQELISWNNTVGGYIQKGNKNRLDNYLERSRLFFEQGILYRSSKIIWKISEPSWVMNDDGIPGFVVKDCTLRCYSGRDSISIYKVSGMFVPQTNEWIGNSGTVKWEKTIYGPDEVFAQLGFYKITLTNTLFYADSVWLQFSQYYHQPLFGSLKHSVASGSDLNESIYPQFTSYDDIYLFTNIFKEVDLQGGIKLEGSRVTIFGTANTDAKLIVKKSGIPVAELLSGSFLIKSGKINSSRSSFCYRFENDSIFHPGLKIQYSDDERELMLLRTGDGLSQGAFFNSYHNLFMYFEALYWNIGRGEMIFGAMRGLSMNSNAVFESANYFTPQRFNSIQGADFHHPLLLVNDYVKIQQSDVFFNDEFADFVKLSFDQANAMLLLLANSGFINYDPVSGRAIVRDRLKFYLDAINKQTDYDVIRFESKVNNIVNARFDLNTFDLEIFGVSQIKLSDPEKVLVFPENKSITMKKGLDFVFQGSINAGFFEFFVGESFCNYKDFKINLPQIDSLAFDVPLFEKEKSGFQKTQKVKTIIKDINGELFIDHPQNKSGIRSFDEYPVFESKNDSYVYFDQPDVQNGVYHRDSFYYHILPFRIESLNSFSTDRMSFNGFLYSGNIFPQIDEPLKVQPDYTLGLTIPVKKNGLSLYGGKATAYIELKLDQQGLHGGGAIKYLSSTSKSEDFIFHPDSMMAKLSEFHLKETFGRIYFPAVFAQDIEQKWIHKQDEMILQSTQKVPFGMYNNQLMLQGTLVLRSSGLFGAGSIDYANAVFNSQDFGFHNNVFSADNSTLVINDPDKNQIFSSASFSFDFDLKQNQGKFIAKDTDNKIELIDGQYITFMDDFRWEVNNKIIYMSNSNLPPGSYRFGPGLIDQLDSDKFPANFISLQPDQDTLSFSASAAQFNMQELSIDISDVPFIELADVVIFTSDGKLNIDKKNGIRQLNNAFLTTGRYNRYHTLYNVTADIKGRKDFTASGVYDYYDDFGQVQNLFFNHIAPDSVGVITGKATVAEIPFYLNPFFDFIGDIFFYSNSISFFYDGAFKIKHECAGVEPHWVKFSGEVDKSNINFPLNAQLLDMEDKHLETSVFFSPSNNKLYAAFLSRKQQINDHPIYKASGNLSYDPLKRDYIISKGRNQNVSENATGYMKLNVDSCIVKTDGLLDFGMNTGQMKMFTSGHIEHFIIPDSTMFRLFLALDFFFDANALEHINKIITKTDLAGIDPGNSLFTNGLSHMLSDTDAQRLLKELNLYGTFRRFPKELMYTMILSNVQLKWNTQTRSFTSIGPIGIATLNNQLVNRYVDGYIELIKRRTGDVITFYLQPTNNEWYYFSYANGIMQAISSNDGFNKVLISLPEKRRKLKADEEGRSYEFIISTIQQRNAFLRKVRNN